MKFYKKKKKKKHLNKGVIMSSDNDIEFMLATVTPDTNYIKLSSMPNLLCKYLLWMTKSIHC